MPVSRSRTLADIRRELESAEARLAQLTAHWQDKSHSTRLFNDGGPSREQLDSVEEVLRQQRGAVERLHQLWIEYAQASGFHAPQ